MNSTAKTIVLIHGLWMTPRSWNNFRRYYEARGHRVLTPPWPRLVGEVEDVRRDPSAMNGLGLIEVADYYEEFIHALDDNPIIMGHSMGGLVVQILLDRGTGAAGVGIDSAAPKGVWRLPLTALKAVFPVLANPRNKGRTVMLTFEQFYYAFANVMSEGAAREAYERDAIPAPGRPLFQAATANFNPWAATKVNYYNHNRPPLLLIAGEKDHIVPCSVVEETYRNYANSCAITGFKDFPGRSHLIVGQLGWEEVADFALTWAIDHTAPRRVAAVAS